MLVLPPEIRRERLITDDYRKQQEELHKNPDYGRASEAYAPIVAKVINGHQVDRVLDYGAGKGNLLKALVAQKLLDRPVKFQHYEPAREEWAFEPDPTEMVCCIDVLEHIEPHLIENVLDDLQRVTQRIGLFTVATTPAMKTLPDGRNAHLIQEEADWWLPKLMARFELHTFQRQPDGFLVLLMAKEKVLS